MRRCRAILVIITLLAAPLALVARSFAAAAADCNGYCCLPHGRHHSQDQSPKPADPGMQCHHGEAGQAMDCAMRSGHPGMDFGLLAPLAPATPSQFDRITAPSASRRTFTFPRATTTVGFLSAPFEPPRA